MTQRSLKGIYTGPSPHWVGDGFKVQGFLPGSARLRDEVSPFLLMDYHPPLAYPPTQQQRGVGSHPHRGFETVTLVWEGQLAHRDTAGNAGVIGPDEVQWMTAASGILHEEFHEKTFAAQSGTLHSVQLWVNLPAWHKMDPPHYQALTREQIVEVALDDTSPNITGSRVRVIAGEFQGHRGPAQSYTPITLLDVRLNTGSSLEVPVPSAHNLFLLVAQGSLILDTGEVVQAQEMALFHRDGNSIGFSARENSIVLVLAGEPIDEPVVSYGPFVMNTQREILEAFQDFQKGKFGTLSEAS